MQFDTEHLAIASHIVCVVFKPGFHLQQNPRPRHKKQSDYVVEQSSFPLIALFWLKICRCRGQNWLYGNQASALVVLVL